MLVKTSLYIPIYLQPFLRYSKLLVENCDIFIHHLCLAAPQGVTPSEFREDLDIHKTRMNGLSCGEESMTICSAVLIQYQHVTDRQTDVQPIAKTCFSIADARKNEHKITNVILLDYTLKTDYQNNCLGEFVTVRPIGETALSRFSASQARIAMGRDTRGNCHQTAFLSPSYLCDKFLLTSFVIC